MPESQLGSLTTFLANNDCSTLPQQADRVNCYKLTRIKLIEVTRQVDEANATSYAARRTVQQLIDNINTIVDGLSSNTERKEQGSATPSKEAGSP